MSPEDELPLLTLRACSMPGEPPPPLEEPCLTFPRPPLLRLVLHPRPAALRASRPAAPSRLVVMNAASLEFVRGVKEDAVPDVKLTKSRDGSSGTATFLFESPSVFEAGSDIGDITGLYMNDEEGTITTVEVQAKFINGKPAKIEARHIMRSAGEWDRFMRFMERYAEEQGLGFSKAG